MGVPVVTQKSSSMDTSHTTYVLGVRLGAQAKNVYTIFGENTNPLVVPPAFHLPPPLGASVGGVDPMFFQFKPASQFDSWLTIGITQGDSGSMGTIGFQFKKWTDKQGLTVTDGAIFWMNPDSGPGRNAAGPKCCVGDAITLAQLTVSTKYQGKATMNVGGRSIHGSDFREHSLEFPIG